MLWNSSGIIRVKGLVRRGLFVNNLNNNSNANGNNNLNNSGSFLLIAQYEKEGECKTIFIHKFVVMITFV